MSIKSWISEHGSIDLRENSDGQAGIMALVGIAIGVMILAVVYIIMPLVGSELDQAVTLPADSQWNASVNTDIETGYDLWGSVGGIITVAAIIVVVAVFLKILVGLRTA